MTVHEAHTQVRRALTSSWHVAVIAGPETGWVAALGHQGLIIGRREFGGAEGDERASYLSLNDPQVSREHCALRVRRGIAQVRDLGSANGTRVTARGMRWLPPPLRWRRRIGGRWQALPYGRSLYLGASEIRVRRRPAELRAPRAPEPRTGSRRDWLRLAMPLVMCLVMVPLLLSISASWWRWFILAMPAAMLASAFFSGRKPRPDPMPDPASLMLLAASGADPATPAALLRADLPQAPGRLTQSSAGTGLGATGDRRKTWPGRWRSGEVMEFHDGERVALVGPGAEAAARWLIAQLATHQGAIVHGAGLSAAISSPASPSLPEESAEERGRWHLVLSDGTAPPRRSAPAHEQRGGRLHLTVAESAASAPHWCTRVISARGPTVSATWLQVVLGFADRSDQSSGGELPLQVTLADLLGPAQFVGKSWGQKSGLRAPLGVGPGMQDLDLAADGPHALVAGTTGSGKSELLLAWMLSLAAAHSPADLQLVLIDYKGGATFGRLAGLPHTAGVLTDLEPASTVRAVHSLQAEVRRRERELARVGVKDLTAYQAWRAAGGAGAGNREGLMMPRLVVVVDEFRELAESHGEILNAQVRLAAQGRSLGIHLILATQRPGGSVSAEIRANLTLRICLRVLESAESQDVVAVADAARLPRLPGRAVMRADGPAGVVQTAWCGEGAWVDEAIAAANAAWRHAGLGPPPRPWAPELPPSLSTADVGEADEALAGPREAGFVLGLADLPAEQRLAASRWRPGGLLLLGGPRSGRTTTLRTLAIGALQAGIAVHILAADPTAFSDLQAPRLGTVVGSGDPRRAARLLDVLTTDATETLLVIDDAETVAEDLDVVAGAGQGSALLSRSIRDARRFGRYVALAGPPSLAGARWIEALRDRLVLAPRSVSEALAAGVPREYAGTPALPGRAVLLEPGRCTVVQVAVAEVSTLPGAADPSVPRLEPVPDAVAATELPGPIAGQVAWGLGGDAAAPVRIDCSPGSVTIILGPPGSGRTTALQTLTAAGAGRARWLTPEHSPPAAGPTGIAPGSFVILDDVERWAPHRLDEVAQVLRDCTVLIGARTDSVTAAYRGALAEWRARATLVALNPEPALKRLVGINLSTAVDPINRRPGLGIVVSQGHAVPVQVAQSSAERRGAASPAERRGAQSSGAGIDARTSLA